MHVGEYDVILFNFRKHTLETVYVCVPSVIVVGPGQYVVYESTVSVTTVKPAVCVDADDADDVDEEEVEEWLAGLRISVRSSPEEPSPPLTNDQVKTVSLTIVSLLKP